MTRRGRQAVIEGGAGRADPAPGRPGGPPPAAGPADGGAPGVVHLFRRGGWYESYDVVPAGPAGPGLCQAPHIMIKDDLGRMAAALGDLAPVSAARRRRIVRAAVSLFRDETVHVGGLGAQRPADFAAALDAAAGLPPALVRRWCELLHTAARTLVTSVPAGPRVGLTLVWLPGNTFTCLEAVCAAVLTSEAVVIRPSSREPVSAARFAAALLCAGWPAGRLAFYPTQQGLLLPLVSMTDRQIVYGGPDVERLAVTAPGFELRGPGRGIAIVEPDADPGAAAAWLVDAIAADSGRFCSNAHTVLCRGDPEPLASDLAAALDDISLWPPDRRWPVAACAPGQAEAVLDFLGKRLTCRDEVLTRRGPSQREAGRTFLAPTLVRVAPVPGHPLIGTELPFPFAVIAAAGPRQIERYVRASRYVLRQPPRPGDGRG